MLVRLSQNHRAKWCVEAHPKGMGCHCHNRCVQQSAHDRFFIGWPGQTESSCHTTRRRLASRSTSHCRWPTPIRWSHTYGYWLFPGNNLCQPHTCVCGATVNARGLHGLVCRKSTPHHINDLIWRVVKKAQISASKEPIGLWRQDVKRPDGATLVPWLHGKPLAWDVTVLDTFAVSHIQFTLSSACAADNKAAVNKTAKYDDLAAMP